METNDFNFVSQCIYWCLNSWLASNASNKINKTTKKNLGAKAVTVPTPAAYVPGVQLRLLQCAIS